MAKVLKLIYKELFHYVEECKDPRTEDYFLMGSPIKIVGVLAVYLCFVKIWGPKFMENRKPYELKYPLIFYNLFQVISNLILGILGLQTILDRASELHCLEVKKGDSGLYEAKLFYCYYLLKVSDLMDTIFFVLRKKYNQVSFLHVYHHVIMALVSYIIVKYIPGGHGGLLGVINCFVHVVMYFYYFLTSFKPELKASIWWKKHITQIQLIQFAILLLHFARPLIFSPDCKFPKFWLVFALLQNLFMLLLFGDFYIKAYLKKTPKGKTQ